MTNKGSKSSISRKSQQHDSFFFTELTRKDLERQNLDVWIKIKLFFYDKEEGTILGKNAVRWGK